MSLRTRTFFAFLLTSALGTLFHFVYDWTGNALVVGLFTPVNESIWEHLKLIFFPILIVTFLEYLQSKDQPPNLICIKLKSALLAMAFTTIAYYTYSGIMGKNIDWLNITIYFIAMALAYIYSYRQIRNENPKGNVTLCLVMTLVIAAAFMIFTLSSPNIGWFQEP